MQKLLDRRRILTPIGALAALAVVCLCIGSLGLTLDYRGRLIDTRHQLASDQRASVALQTGTYQACLLRNKQGLLVDSLEKADVLEQRSLIKIETRNPALTPQVRHELLSVFRDKLAANLRYLAAPKVPCSRLKPKTVTSSSGD